MSEKGQDHFSPLPCEILSQIFQICKQQEEKKDVNRVSDLRLVCKKFHLVVWDPINLTELDLRDDNLERLDVLEQVLLQRPHLKTLRLRSDKEMLVQILKQASTLCPNLKYLDIMGVYGGNPQCISLKLNPMAAIEKIHALIRLSIQFCNFENEDEMFQSIANSNVEDFSYRSDQASAQKKEGMGKVLQGLRNKLTCFTLDCEILDNNLLSLICQCEHLEKLDLPRILKDEIVDLSLLSKLKKLRTLYLDECGDNFTGPKVSQCLKGIVRLEELDIRFSYTFCESDLKAVVESSPNLKFLSIHQCQKLRSEDVVLKCTAPLKKLENVDHLYLSWYHNGILL